MYFTLRPQVSSSFKLRSRIEEKRDTRIEVSKLKFRANRHGRAGSATVACIRKPGFDLSEGDFVRYYETQCLRSCPELLVSRIDFNGDPVDIVWGTLG